MCNSNKTFTLIFQLMLSDLRKYCLWICLILPWAQISCAADVNFDDVQSDPAEFLAVDQSFALNASVEKNNLRAEWTIAEGYYLYQQRIHLLIVDAAENASSDVDSLVKNAKVVESAIFDRKADKKNDPNFGVVDVFHSSVVMTASLEKIIPLSKTYVLLLQYQGCAQAGLCYPAQTRVINVDALGNGRLQSAENTEQQNSIKPASSQPVSQPTSSLDSADGIAGFLQGASLWLVLATFLVLGIGLSLTPCVLPMVPILSGIIAGHGENLTVKRGLQLSGSYVFGMALSYAIAGVIVGYCGASANISAWLQTPWVLSIFAGIFVVLALSMFGLYELQLPSGLMNRLNNLNQNQQGGSLKGVFVMGVLSALVVSPCVSAPLAGALVYISTTGNALLGGLALFALGLGMGVPLIAIGAGGGALVPKAGNWMLVVKAVFGVLLLAVALWLLARFLPASIMLVLWALLLLGSAVAMGALDSSTDAMARVWRACGIALLVWSILLFVGAASGAKNPLQPLEKFAAPVAEATATKEVNFTKVTTNKQLDEVLATAKQQSKAVLVDYYADWCTACLEMAHSTFSDPRVATANVMMVQVDITQNTKESQALLKRFGLFAPPSLVFFNSRGEQQKSLTVMGEIAAGPLLTKLASLK